MWHGHCLVNFASGLPLSQRSNRRWHRLRALLVEDDGDSDPVVATPFRELGVAVFSVDGNSNLTPYVDTR